MSSLSARYLVLPPLVRTLWILFGASWSAADLAPRAERLGTTHLRASWRSAHFKLSLFPQSLPLPPRRPPLVPTVARDTWTQAHRLESALQTKP